MRHMEMPHVETSEDVGDKVPVTQDKSLMPAQENPVPTNSIGFPPIQLKPTSIPPQSREMIDDSGIPKKISQQGLLNLSEINSLDSFASASTLMTEVARRQADLNAMGNSTASSSNPKRQKRNVTPEIPVSRITQKREIKVPVRYGDEDLTHKNVKKVPVPSKSKPKSTPASVKKKDKSTEQVTPAVTVISKNKNKIRKTLKLELSCTTIDTPADTTIMRTSTQFGEFCENQRVLALKNDGDNFFCPGKIIQKSLRKGKWIVSFDQVQKILSQDEIIPVNVLGNGVCGFYRNLCLGEPVIPNTDVVILAHAKSNKISALRYSIEYTLYGKDGYGWVDWTEIEVHGKELTRLLEEWRQHNQQIEAGAQNLGNSSAPAPPE